MLDLLNLLTLKGIDPTDTIVVRHAPKEKALRTILPSLVMERPDLFLAYQRIQWKTLEKAMTKARYFASFVGQEAATGTFAGLYRINGWETLTYEGYCSAPGNAELMELGMTGRTPDMGDCLIFDLEPLDAMSEWIGKLMISWPMPHQLWWRWAARVSFPVVAIATENRFARGMPAWHNIVLTWPELQTLPASWSATMAEWRGIYFIYDTSKRAGYVGSAYGRDNLLGRWRDYARTGHGNNRELRDCDPRDLRFSILQRTSPDLEPEEVIALEGNWKERLHTREFGLNLN